MLVWKMASIVCFLVAFVGGGYVYFNSKQQAFDSPGLVIVETNLFFNGLMPGTHEEYFVATNLSKKPIRIVGTNYSCGQNACSGPPENPVNEIPSKTTLKIPFKLIVNSDQNTFQTKMRIYVDDPSGLRDFEFTLSGTLLETGSP